ncbi:hypothetical protein GCM10027289_29630 [Tsukamurella serpentis]
MPGRAVTPEGTAETVGSEGTGGAGAVGFASVACCGMVALLPPDMLGNVLYLRTGFRQMRRGSRACADFAGGEHWGTLNRLPDRQHSCRGESAAA